MTHKQKEDCRLYIILGILGAFILGATVATYFG